MFFSVIGDAFLVYFEYFLLGMGAFAVAQVAYIAAFGWERTKPVIGIGLYILAAVFLVSYILPEIEDNLIKVRQPPSVTEFKISLN